MLGGTEARRELPASTASLQAESDVWALKPSSSFSSSSFLPSLYAAFDDVYSWPWMLLAQAYTATPFMTPRESSSASPPASFDA